MEGRPNLHLNSMRLPVSAPHSKAYPRLNQLLTNHALLMSTWLGGKGTRLVKVGQSVSVVKVKVVLGGLEGLSAYCRSKSID